MKKHILFFILSITLYGHTIKSTHTSKLYVVNTGRNAISGRAIFLNKPRNGAVAKIFRYKDFTITPTHRIGATGNTEYIGSYDEISNINVNNIDGKPVPIYNKNSYLQQEPHDNEDVYVSIGSSETGALLLPAKVTFKKSAS